MLSKFFCESFSVYWTFSVWKASTSLYTRFSPNPSLTLSDLGLKRVRVFRGRDLRWWVTVFSLFLLMGLSEPGWSERERRESFNEIQILGSWNENISDTWIANLDMWEVKIINHWIKWWDGICPVTREIIRCNRVNMVFSINMIMLFM